jgi:hypothetical protein
MNRIKQVLTSKQAFISFIYITLLIDILYKITRHRDTILDWQFVVILGLLTFATIGDRIRELIIGKEGITLKQNIDSQILEIQKDAENIQLINNTGDSKYVDSLLKRVESPNRDIWSKLIIYRLTLRALIGQICKAKGMVLSDSPSLTSMIAFMQDENLITNQFRSDLDFIRHTTFFFEWGTVNPPTTEEIKRVLDITPQILKYLEYMVESKV